MTVGELKRKLKRFPNNLKVFLDKSRDYEEYGEATRVEKTEFSEGFSPPEDAVLID